MKILPLILGGLTLTITAASALAATYNGNAASGFGGVLGNGTLTITQNSSTVDFTFVPGAAFNNDDVVIYLDTTAGGFNSTSSFTDNGDAGRTAISGFNSTNATRTVATFPSGFGADLAISLQPVANGNFAGLFNLTSTANFAFIEGMAPTPGTGGALSFSLSRTGLGLPANGGGFGFVASLISTTAYRSNETIGTSATTPGVAGDTPNAGFNGTTTYSTYAIFDGPVPEPGTVACLGLGAAALVGGLIRRRARK